MIAAPYTMFLMIFPGRRSGDTSDSPDFMGDRVAGRLSVSFADPVTRLEEDHTTDLTARSAPRAGRSCP